MKRLLILFFIPTLSYSQITFEDIMNINSEKTFKRVMIENGFENDRSNLEHWILYGLNIKRDSVEENKSSLWGSYNKRNGEFNFQISVTNSFGLDFFGRQINDNENSLYDEIVEKIKKNCKYYDVIEYDGVDLVCYSCSQSSYKGKIGFTKSEGSGYIQHIIPKKPITYKDIMSINSVKTFNKVMTENGYEFNESNDLIVSYGNDILRDSIMGVYSSEWGVYRKTDDIFYFKYGYNDDYDYDFYDVLISDIKKNCTFYDTLKNIGDFVKRDYVSYSCSESTYRGKIGYVTTDSVSYISHIIPTEN